MLVSIPVTSFPLLSRLGANSLVAPLSLVPLLILVVVWMLPRLMAGRPLPGQTRPLLAFIGIACLATVVSAMYPILPYRDSLPNHEAIVALFTLAIGASYYLVAASFAESEPELVSSLRWLSLGGAIMLLWSGVQMTWLPRADDPMPLRWVEVHHWFSIRDPFRDRVTGMAYEPSWFADQLVVLYLPLWIASTIRRKSILAPSLRVPAPEAVLLVWGLITLYFSFSRIGWLALALMGGSLFTLFAWRAIDRRWNALLGRLKNGKPWQRIAVAASKVAGLLLAVLVVVAVALLAVNLGAQFDDRLAKLLETDYSQLFLSQQHPLIYELPDRVAFAERIMYWTAGLRTFGLYPILGVGLGKAGFLFPATVPYFGFYLPEVISAVEAGGAWIPNVKSLWIRLLAETGLAGFLTFTLWLTGLGVRSWANLVRAHSSLGVIGIAGLLALAAQLVEGFSLDTFALPQLWVMLGLVTAALRVADRQSLGQET